MDIIREIYPEGTEIRWSRKLCRLSYISPGPDHCWNMDGYDILNLFELPIHEISDRFSRKVISLRVNNKTSVVATFYVDALKKEKKAPSILTTDCGTENGDMAAIPCYLPNRHLPAQS